jgi:hypothetical protein
MFTNGGQMRATIEWDSDNYVESYRQGIVLKQHPWKYIPIFSLTVTTDLGKALHSYRIYLKGVTGELHIEEQKR